VSKFDPFQVSQPFMRSACASKKAARMDRKSRLFAHSILSPDSWVADIEVEIDEAPARFLKAICQISIVAAS
jgi:hypothetical protein